MEIIRYSSQQNRGTIQAFRLTTAACHQLCVIRRRRSIHSTQRSSSSRSKSVCLIVGVAANTIYIYVFARGTNDELHRNCDGERRDYGLTLAVYGRGGSTRSSCVETLQQLINSLTTTRYVNVPLMSNHLRLHEPLHIDLNLSLLSHCNEVK